MKPTHFIEQYCDGRHSGILPIGIFRTWYEPHYITAVFKIKFYTNIKTNKNETEFINQTTTNNIDTIK